jgi:hypothetical protein
VIGGQVDEDREGKGCLRTFIVIHGNWLTFIDIYRNSWIMILGGGKLFYHQKELQKKTASREAVFL